MHTMLTTVQPGALADLCKKIYTVNKYLMLTTLVKINTLLHICTQSCDGYVACYHYSLIINLS